jgi:hypothetical protein
MENAAIRQKLHDYIDSVDESKLQAMYIILQTDMEQEYSYSDEVIAELHQRRDNHVKGVSASYTVAETLDFVRGQRK